MSSPGVHSIGIIGSGIMGAGIAEVLAGAGFATIVRSRSADSANDVVTRVTSSLDRRVARGKLEEAERTAILGRLSATTNLVDLADCDIVIESVVEDLPTKKSLFAELDAVMKPTAILATNTSTLPVSELALSTSRPDKVCGIHFFNPATTMSLVEIVRPATAGDDTISIARDVITSCGKDAVLVRDDAGFVVNALLFPYLNNAIKMFECGTASMEDIDTAMKGGCNFPMGPFALLDLVGLDTSLAIIRTLHAASRNPADEPADTLVRLVDEGHLGRKTGRGFFTY
jgi:3-hydroxybutyryl-CoA dehydrogenase